MFNVEATKEEQRKHHFTTCTCIQSNLKYRLLYAGSPAAAYERGRGGRPLMSGDVDGLVAAEQRRYSGRHDFNKGILWHGSCETSLQNPFSALPSPPLSFPPVGLSMTAGGAQIWQ